MTYKPNEKREVSTGYKLEDVTPRPWVTRFGYRGQTVSIDGKNGKSNNVCKLATKDDFNERNANAKHIVHCVNKHDKLVADNETLVALVEELVRSIEYTCHGFDNRVGECDKCVPETGHECSGCMIERVAKKATETLATMK